MSVSFSSLPVGEDSAQDELVFFFSGVHASSFDQDASPLEDGFDHHESLLAEGLSHLSDLSDHSSSFFVPSSHFLSDHELPCLIQFAMAL